MNPLTQRLLMSAAGKGVIPGAWNSASIGVNENIRSAGVLTGKLSVGTSIGRVYSLNNGGSWELADVLAVNSSPITRIDSLSTAGGNYRVCTARASVTTRISDTPGGAGNGLQLRSFSDAAWGSGNSQVLALRIVRNGVWIIAGENGAYAQSLSYGDTATWTTATIPGATGLGSLGDVVEIIYKETAAYSGDTTGWWAFLRGGRYVHTSGASYNGITNSNPNLFSGETARTDLSSLFQSGETILSVDFVLNQFVVLTSFGRIFLSYTGFNWELRKDIRTGVNNHSFQDAVFDGQNYLVLASLQPGNNQIQVFTNKLENDTDFYDYNRFTIESAQQQPLGNFIFYYNNRYYIGLPGGQYLYKDVSVTPLTKPILVPLEMTTYTNFVSQPVFINYYNDVDQKYETQDVVIINNIGNTYRESTNGVTVQVNNSVVFRGYSPRTTTENYRRLIPISGNNNKLLIFGRRYRFRTVQAITDSPPTGFQEQGSINFVNQWGNANFLGFDGAFANNKLLVSLPSAALTSANLQYCRYLDGMFMNCTALNSFLKFPNAELSSIWGMSSMLRNCSLFNQPIVNVDGGMINTTRLVDLTSFLENASKFNNKIDINFHDFSTGARPRNLIYLSSMFSGCRELTGQFDSSISNLKFGNDPAYTYWCNSMFNGCWTLNTSLATSGLIWNTSNITLMSDMFSSCYAFNGSLAGWDVGKNTSFGFMFYSATAFNQDISSWNTSNALYMPGMFAEAQNFNKNISYNPTTGAWNTANVITMAGMFTGATKFNNGETTDTKAAPLNWNTSKVTTMESMFRNAFAFNQNLNLLNTGNVTTMSRMFENANKFNGNVSTWNTSKVITMNSMFSGASKFNSPLPYDASTGVWNTGNVTDMQLMFSGATDFNQNIGTWNVSKVTNMAYMFSIASSFNNLGSNSIQNWLTGSVTNMTGMFAFCSAFNQPINYNSATGAWDVSKVTSMLDMFTGCGIFEQDISRWNVSSVTNMEGMFEGCLKFNSDISDWDVSRVTTMKDMFSVTSFDTGSVFNQPIGKWGQKTSLVTNMSGMFRGAIKFNRDLSAWNTANVTDMSEMFAYLSSNSVVSVVHEFNSSIGSWNTSKVRNMNSMFRQCAFNQPIDYNSQNNSWDTDSVIDMSGMFYNSRFNQPISNWRTRNVTTFAGMFLNNTVFNQLISNWNTSNVTNMQNMFQNATAFNNGGFLFDRYLRTDGTATGWDTSKVTNMQGMFSGSGFNTKNFSHTLDEFRLGYPSNPRSQRLTSWCVTLIPLAPTNFGFTTNAPVWGTCPALQSVPVPAPVVDFSASPLTGVAPLTVSFTGSATNFPTSYAWDFNNDGVTDNTSQNAVHVYNAAGTYSVKFTATNAGGSGVSTKSNYITVTPAIFARTISQDLQEVNLRSWAISQGWNGSDQVRITLDTGYYIWSNNTGVAALTIDGSFPKGVSFINKGFVIGCGGRGGGIPGSGQVGGIGGHAINLGTGAGITNDGYIAGGGGGGGGWGGGGGAGGGAGGDFAYTNGGAGGSIRNAGSTGSTISNRSGGGGGGRILPGSGGAQAGPGAPTSTVPGNGGGAGGSGQSFNLSFLTLIGAEGRVGGGGGGGWGAAGGIGYNGQSIGGLAYGGAGGSAGSAGSNGFGGTSNGVFAGGAGGKAINQNGNIVIYSGSGIRYGATS